MESTTTSSFDINSLILKVTVKQGDSLEKVLTVSKGTGENINFEVVSVSGVSLSSNNFLLSKDESKNIIVTFDSKKLEPGVYVGSIKVSDSKNTIYLPVLFEVESLDVFYDINLDIPPAYSSIVPGEKIVTQIKILDLTWAGITQGLGANTVKLDYAIYSISGKQLVAESESVIIDRQTQITKTVAFPKSATKGDYVFVAIARYKSSVGVSSYLFSVSDETKKDSSLNDSRLSWFLGAIVLIFLIVVGFFVYIIKSRDSIIRELKSYNDEEFSRKKALILQQGELLKSKGNSGEEVDAEIRNKLNDLKVKQEQRVSELVKLKSNGDVESMKRKLAEWKSKGYNTGVLDYKLSNLSEEEMGAILKKWKETYQTGNKDYKKSS